MSKRNRSNKSSGKSVSSRSVKRQSSRTRSDHLVCERLEDRRLLALNVPLHSSLPGAPVTIHLDFDGTPPFLFNESKDEWASGPLPGDNDPIPAFSLDGDLLNFSAGEIAAITEIWQFISEVYSPFNINVTTDAAVVPVGYPDGQAIHAIMGGMNSDWGDNSSTTLGVALEGAFTNGHPNSAFTFTGSIVANRNGGGTTINQDTRHQIALVSAHEIGHVLGLKHQSKVDGGNNITEEYSSGDSSTAPIMGGAPFVSNVNKRALWWKGPSSVRNSDDELIYTGIQDDLAGITRPGNYVTFRPDNESLNINSATGAASLNGVIETNGSSDDLAFNPIGPIVSFTVNAATFGKMLMPTLELIPLGGSAAGSVTVTTTNTSATLNATNLTPGGGYLLRVKPQAGTYGNIGQYFLSGNIGTFASLSEGTLKVDGFEADNDLMISYIASTDKIVLQNNIFGGAAIQQFPRSQVSRIVVEFLNGHDDTISVFGQFSVLNIPITIEAGSSIDLDKLLLQGTSGNDYMALHSDSSAQVNNTPITITTGLLAHLVEVRMSGFDGDDVFDISVSRDPLVILAGGHNDTINLGTGLNDFLTITAPVFVYGDSGSDELNLGNGNASAIAADVTFDGGVGGGGVIDSVNYNDGANISTVEYTVDYDVFSVAPRTVVRNAFASNWTLFYNNLSEINIYAGSGHDFFTVGSDVAEIVRCYGNSGNDFMTYGDGVLLPLSGQLFNGGAGEDTLILDDHNNPGSRTWQILTDRVIYAGTFVFGTAGFEGVSILSGNGQDEFFMGSTSAYSQAYTLDGGGGLDRMTISGARIASLTLRGGNDQDLDFLEIDDRNYPGNMVGGTVFADRISRETSPLAPSEIGYSGFTNVTWDLQATQNFVIVQGLVSNFSIVGNSFNDYVEVYTRDALNNKTINGNLNFVGGDDVDTLKILSGNLPADYRFFDAFGSGNAIIAGAGSGWIIGAPSVESINAIGSPGNDTFDVDQFRSGAALTILGGAGDDTCTIGNGDMSMNLTNAAAFTFDGGDGSDRFTIDNQATDETWSYVVRDGSVVADISGLYTWTSMTPNIESQSLLAGTADDFFVMLAVAQGVLTETHGGAGYDGMGLGFSLIDVTLDSVRGPVVFNAGAGGGRLYVDDADDTSGDVVHLTASTLGAHAGDTLFGPGGSLAFSGLTNLGSLTGLTLNTGSGADTIFAQPLATTRVEINAGNPATSVGDALNLALAGAQNANVSGGSSGSVTSSNLQTLNWTGIEEGISVDDVAPQVVASSYNETAGSMVVFQFSEPVSVKAADLRLFNTSTGQLVPASAIALSYDPATRTARFTFPGLTNGLLTSGIYEASMANTVTDSFGNAIEPTAPLQFNITRTVTWVAAGNGAWDDPNNWENGQVPGVHDAVEIAAIGGITVTIPAGSFGAARLFSNASLLIASGATFTIGGAMTVRDASVSNFGLFEVFDTVTLDNATFENSGEFTGRGSFGFDLQNLSQINNIAGAIFGGFGGSITGQGNFVNDGLLFVHTGTFGVAVGGSSTGTVEVADGAAVSFSGGYLFDSGTRFDGDGLVQLLSPTDPCRFMGDVTVSGVTVENSGLVDFMPVDGAGSVTFADGANWHNASGGNMGLPGFIPDFDFHFGGDGYFVNDGLLYVHSGSFGLGIATTSSGGFEVAEGAVLSFDADSVFQQGTDFHSDGGGAVQFTSNECRFEGVVTMFGILAYNNCVGEFSPNGGIQTGGGATIFNEPGGVFLGPTVPGNVAIIGDGTFVNNGLVNVRGGTFSLGAGSSSGTFQVADGALLQFDGGFTLGNATTFAGTGSVLVQPLVSPDPKLPPNPVRVIGNVSATNLNIGAFGAVDVAGSLSLASTLNIQAQGTLSGTGTIAGNVVSAGQVHPGSSPGVLTINGNFLQTGGVLKIELGGASAGLFDQLRVRGTVTLGGSLEATFVNGFVPAAGSQFVIVDNDLADAVAGSFASLPEGSLITAGNRILHLSYLGGTGNDVLLTDVTTAALIPDSVNPGKLALLVVGTANGDVIQILPVGKSGVKAVVNGINQGEFTPTGRVIVRAGEGDDDVKVADGASRSAWIYGEGGHDTIKGGAGANMLLGGSGNDMITGGDGRDVLIGGLGEDRMIGGGSDDLLIGGTTAYDTNEAALWAVLAEWSSTRPYEQRITNLRGTGNGTPFANRLNANYFLVASGPNMTVFDDNAEDKLTGSKERDWFFANLDSGVKDFLTDRASIEWVDEVE